MVAVSDDGCGMEAETLDMVFEPFFTTKKLGEGTGLGLATVYGIVKQNNGFINVYSEPGKGTIFKVYLPREKERETEMDEAVCDDMPLGKGEMILLVEDEAHILKLGKRTLESLGYTVLSASRPTRALVMAEEHKASIKLVVTDVIMPEMNGRELSEKIEQICPGVKTIYMSGYTANVIAHRGVLDSGINFVPKPFSKKDMAVKVWQVLHDSSDNA